MSNQPAKRRPKRTLNNRKEKAVLALLAGASVTEAAEQAGVRRQTVSEWCHHDPLFAEELDRRRAELWASIRGRFEQATAKAVDVLIELMDDDAPHIRLAAASRVVGTIAQNRPEPNRSDEGVRGGVLLVPGPMTPEEWEAAYGAGPRAE